MNALASGVSPRRMGNSHANLVPYDVYPVSDGHLIIAVGNDAQFQKLCALLDLPDLARFETNASRLAARAEVDATIATMTRNWTRQALLEALHAIHVPAGPINSVSEALSDPQIAARGMVLSLPGGLSGVRTPLRFSEATLDTAAASPRLGQRRD